MSMFTYINNQLCIKASALYDELGLMSYYSYQNNRSRRDEEFVSAQYGGNGRKAYLYYGKLPDDLQNEISSILGSDPYHIARRNELIDLLEYDQRAVVFYREWRFDDGIGLAEETQRKYCANANVLNAIGKYIAYRNSKRGHRRKGSYWDEILQLMNDISHLEYPHDLPKKATPLRRKHERYIAGEYESLIHKGHRNKNTEKIDEASGDWLVARYASNVDRLTIAQIYIAYNHWAKSMGLKELKDENSIRNFLYRPEVKERWYGMRHGWLVSKNKYEYQHSTKLPSMRDSLWYSDGTKLNLYYMDEEGKVRTTSVYEVIDSYSEVFLGYCVSDKEDFEAQFNAYRMAVEFSEHKPYEVRYDNQGGHKKLSNTHFLTQLSHLSFTTKPYNGRSKTIESVFKRFQEQYLSRRWYFTGMNIQSKKQVSKANMEYIQANKASLPSLDEVIAEYVQMREEWNRAKHPATGISRIEMYEQSENPRSVPVDRMDMVELFWLTRKESVKLTAYGLTFKEKRVAYTYIPYTEDGLPDISWMRKNIDKDFWVRFDPMDMSLIFIYEKSATGLRFVRELETKVEIHRGKQEQQNGEVKFIKAVERVNEEAMIENRKEIEEVMRNYETHPEQYGHVVPHIPGINRNKQESTPKPSKISIGESLKALSNVTPKVLEKELDEVYSLDDEDIDLYDII